VECDCAVVLDETLFGPTVKNGLKPNATVIINSVRGFEMFPIEGCRVLTVDATNLALKTLGRAITNVPMLGALIAATDIAKLESVYKAIDSQLAERLREKNKILLKETYDNVKERMGK
jgi:pyruvate ferredoxin oxidoreductase gamma subunit